MKRDMVFYVMPIGDIWVVRATGSSAEAYPTEADALAAAERLTARGARVRVLTRAGTTANTYPSLARTLGERKPERVESVLDSVAS